MFKTKPDVKVTKQIFKDTYKYYLKKTALFMKGQPSLKFRRKEQKQKRRSVKIYLIKLFLFFFFDNVIFSKVWQP